MKKLILIFFLLLIHQTVFCQQFIKTIQGCRVWVNPGTSKTIISWNDQCIDGYVSGVGKLSWHEGNNLILEYLGEMRLGKFHGNGAVTFANGNKYVGEWKDDKRNGQGMFTYADGRIWLGDWFEDKTNGRLIKFSSNGTVQEAGIYKDGRLVT